MRARKGRHNAIRMDNLEQKFSRDQNRALGVQVDASPMLSAKVESDVKPGKMLSSSSSSQKDGEYVSRRVLDDGESKLLRSSIVLRSKDGDDSSIDISITDLPVLTRQGGFRDSFGSSSPPNLGTILEETPSIYGGEFLKPPRLPPTPQSIKPNYREYLSLSNKKDRAVYNLDGRIVTPFLKFDTSTSNKYMVADLRGGCRLSPEFLSLPTNRRIKGFLSYFTFGDLYPLFYFHSTKDRSSFDAYYRQLWFGTHSWRGGDVSPALWTFFLSLGSLIPSLLTLDFVEERRRDYYLFWRDNLLKKALDFHNPLARDRRIAAAAQSLSRTFFPGLENVNIIPSIQPLVILFKSKIIQRRLEFVREDMAIANMRNSLGLSYIHREMLARVSFRERYGELRPMSKMAKDKLLSDVLETTSRKTLVLEDVLKEPMRMVYRLLSKELDRDTCMKTYSFIGNTVEELQGPFTDSIRRKIARKMDIWTTFRSTPPRGNLAFATERLWSSYKADAADSVLDFGLLFADKIQTIDTIFTMIKHGENVRALLHFLKMVLSNYGIVSIVRALISSVQEYSSLGTKWLSPTAENLDLEVEDVEGPYEVFDSLLYKKFSILLAAFLAEPILNKLPNFLQNTVQGVLASVRSLTSLGDLYEALRGFSYVFLERCQEFCISWDWKVFLDSGGFSTWLLRANEWIQASGSKTSEYSTILEVIQAGEALKEEGENYLSSEFAKNNPGKKWTTDHSTIHRILCNKLTKVRNDRDSAEPRTRVPYTGVFLGRPGTGKTYLCAEILRYALIKKGRPLDEHRNPVSTGADMYMVPKDKHWNNCHDPVVVVFNDLLGDGYVNNGSTANMADLLRLAADIEPFYTPQASLEDKLKCVIDPDGVIWTGNTMVYDFSCFGTDWKKLIRRYKKAYYCAFPSRYYSVDIQEVGDDDGELIDETLQFDPSMKDEMRYYSCKMLHRAGRIYFVREKLVATGVDVFLTLVRSDYRESLQTKQVVPIMSGLMRCCEDKPLASHTERCCYDCDWVDPTPRVDRPGTVNPLYDHPLQIDEVQCWPVVDAVSDEVSDRVAKRYEVKIRQVFADMKPYFSALAFAITAGLGVWGIYSGIRLSRRKPESPVKEYIESREKVAEAEGAVINPIKAEFTPAFLDIFTPSEAKAKESPNPATWASTSRAYATFSTASKSAAFEDVVAKVRSNTIQFYADTEPERFGTGVFLSANYLLVNKHTVDYFKGKMLRIRRPEDNCLRYEFDFHITAFDQDLCVAKVPPFPASNILDHVAIKVGTSFEGNFMAKDVTVLKQGISFRGIIGLDNAEALCYQADTVKGNCGEPLIAKVGKNGAFVGIHTARLANGSGAAWPVLRSTVDKLIAAIGDRPVGVIMQPLVTEVQCLYEKSKLRSAKGVSMVVLGTVEKANKQAKSSYVYTPMAAEFLQLMESCKTIPTLHIDGVRRDEGWMAPYVHKFKGMSLNMLDAHQFEMAKALEDYVDRMPVDYLRPLALSQVIAGVEGDKLLKKLNMKTSSGIYQRFYPDKSYLLNLDDLTITSELKAKVEEKAFLLRDHVIVEHQKWALKDELVELSKEFIKKYRYFMISDFDNLILFRIFVSPLVAHMYRHRAFFESCGAFNPASPQFGELVNWIRRFQFLTMADIKHMDSTYRSLIAEYVAQFFYILSKNCGYNDEAANVVRNLLRATCFSIVELSGDWAFFSEGMGSGIYVTFVVNCVILSLLYRVAWFRLNDTPFREHNALIAGGDDSANSTDDERFDGFHIMRVFRDYGYEVSPPTNKTGEIVRFYDHSSLVFLKRSPATVVCGGKTYEVGKLAEDSIIKPLIAEMPSPEVSHRDRMAQVIDAACREMALHGLEKFLDFKKRVDKYGYAYRDLSYDSIIQMYVKGDLYDGIDDPFYPPEIQVVDVDFYPLSEFVDSLQRKRESMADVITHDTASLSIEKLSVIHVASTDHVPEDNWEEACGGVRVYNTARYIKGNTLSDFIGHDQHNTSGQKTTTFELASGMVSSSNSIHPSADYGMIESPITLATSLGRPTYLMSFSWTPTSPSSTTSSEIYTVWRTDSFIASKLHGFKFFRGRPKLRFVVNGFVFYYGKLVCAIDMNPGSDTLHPGYDPQVNSFSLNNVCQACMAPHVSIDPSVSATYDLEVPWYSANGWYNLFNLTETPTLRIKFFPLNALASANDVAPTSVDVKVYLIMDDVELSVPAVAALEGPGDYDVEELQGPGETQPTGTISKPLMAISKVAGMVKIIPELAPFAGPIELVSGIGSRIAHMLGYSKPIILEESRPLLNLVASQPTYVDGRVGVTKLTGDPKQEVAVTAAAASVGQDNDMLIGSIVTRPGLIQQITWSTLGLSGSQAIFPTDNSDFHSLTAVQYIPLSWVSSLFKYWSGSIVVRIEIVASGMHRGAIAASWVPYDDPPGGSVLDYPNRFLTKIIDITETKVVDFVIPFAGDQPNLPVTQNNGVLRFYEINPLKSSGSTSSVGINIYMFAGDDFQLYRPELSGTQLLTYLPVSAVEGPGDDLQVSTSDEHSGDTKVVQDTMSGREKIYFGETFSSIKQLCNREVMQCVFSSPVATDTNGLQVLKINPYPIMPVEASQLESGNAVYGFSYPAYFAPAFLSMRGGFRFKVVNDARWGTSTGTYPQPRSFTMRVYSRENSSFTGDWCVSTREFLPGSFTAVTVNSMANTASGSALDNMWIHPACEFELPYTTPTRFINPRKQISWYKANSAGLVPTLAYNSGTSDGGAIQFEVWYSASDDFSLHGFMFIPEMRNVNFA